MVRVLSQHVSNPLSSQASSNISYGASTSSDSNSERRSRNVLLSDNSVSQSSSNAEKDEDSYTTESVTIPILNLDAGLVQFEVSPSNSDGQSGASFEVVNLPDFSSLAIADNAEASGASLPVFLDPVSSFPSSSYEKETNNMLEGNPEDLRAVLHEITKENARLSRCLQDSTRILQKLAEERSDNMYHFHRTRDFLHKVKKEAADTNGVIDTKVNRKESKKDKKAEKKAESKNGVENNVALVNLSQQLDVAEEAQAQLSQDLQRVTQEKLEAQNQLASLNLEYETVKANVEQLNREKWEITQVNNDLQQRLQQTVALAHMQAEGNQSRLQEEVGRMLFQLEEERKVTANLSKNLELERRKVESLEQKAKGNSSTRGSSKGERRRSSLLPDEVRDNESRLAQSMELYRQRCDNLGTSLASCQAKLEDEHYCGDLTTEVNKLRKLLAEEKKKVGGENSRLSETHALFEQIYLDYMSTIESVKQAQHEKKMKSQQQSVLNNIAESNMRDNVDSMTARLMQAEDALAKERRDNQQAREALAQAALDLEALPLLQAQVEVYQSDFNAERLARERIAGEKADLEEQLRKAGIQKGPTGGGGFEGVQHKPTGQGGQFGARGGVGGGGGYEQPRVNGLERGNLVRERMNSLGGREQPYDNIPRTVNTRPDQNQQDEKVEAFTCPKCNREFRNTTLLTRHVNDCLDRDF